LVANCNADVGSCVTATEVNPANVEAVPPRLIAVEPIVKDELVSALFGMFVNVLAEPDMDLLVNVCAAVRVATVSPATLALVDAVKVVKAPVLAVVAPTEALLMVPPVYAPPVMVLPVKVKAAGKDNVTTVVPAEVISFAVPLTVVTAPIEEALIDTLEAAVS
jgi:hypothetical protein